MRGFRPVSIVLWAVLAAIVAGIAALLVFKAAPDEVDEPEEKSMPVRTVVVTPRPVRDVIQVPGHVAAFRDLQLAAELGGRVVALHAELGDRVEQGEALLHIDSRTWEAALRQAEIEHRDAQRELRRWEELAETGAVSESDIDRVRKTFELAEAALAQAKTQVSKTDVLSPVAGVVDARYVEEGEYVNEGMPVFRVVVIDPVKVIVYVPERDVLAVEVGQELAFAVDSVPDRVFTGTVSHVALASRPRSNSFETEALVPNPEGVLRPGMIARVALERGVLENAIVAPLAAVIARKGEHVVFVANAERAVRRRVSIRSIIGTEAVLEHGVEPGEKLIVEGHRALQDGMLLDVREGEPVAPAALLPEGELEGGVRPEARGARLPADGTERS